MNGSENFPETISLTALAEPLSNISRLSRHSLQKTSQYRDRKTQSDQNCEASRRSFEVWLDDAIAHGITEPHAVTLSTVDEQGHPDARVLILKGLDERGWHFAAKSTSPKGQQIEKNAEVALTFYWPKLGRQVRIRGRAHPQSVEDCARDFAERALSSKISAAASKQSEILSSPGELKRTLKSAESLFAEHPDKIMPSWKVYAVAPTVVEFWQGATDRMHKRLVYQSEGGAAWKKQELWP